MHPPIKNAPPYVRGVHLYLISVAMHIMTLHNEVVPVFERLLRIGNLFFFDISCIFSSG